MSSSLSQPSLSLPVVILKNIVIFPKTIVPVLIGRTFSAQAVEYALETPSREIIVIVQKTSEKENPGIQDFQYVATRANILQALKTTKGTYKVLLEGLERISLQECKLEEFFWQASYTPLATTCTSTPNELEALWRTLKTSFHEYITETELKLSETILPESPLSHEMEIAVDTLATQCTLKTSDKYTILSLKDLKERISFLILCLKTEVEIIETEERIQKNIQNQIESTQREYYLHEQLKAIEKELKNEKKDNETNQYKKLAKQARVPADIYERVEKEITRLEQMQPLSAEAAISRTYLDWIVGLPWYKQSKDIMSLDEAEKLLDKSHEGLKKAKERILEFIAARKFSKGTIRSPIICLVGPPGVGKTSLVKSIAETLNREFIRISLGGVRDEAEIRGHRKTYIGAMPGKILQGMKKAKTINPVFLLDEIDKISSDIHGDPAAALLEVLDPEQNKQFMDNYLEVPYDLSKIIFIATANSEEPIPYALHDRMEIIYLSGYTVEEKLHIAEKFLIPKHTSEHKLNENKILFQSSAVKLLINEYTREAGVRNLERLIVRCCQKAIKDILQSKKNSPVSINSDKIKSYFKAPLYKQKNASLNEAKIGIVTGLAWTSLGGEVLEVEVALTQGKGNILLTGQLGEVMQESAQAALTYLKMHAKDLHISKKLFLNQDIHIHVPEGATPKDGPSAGITMCTALASAFTGISVHANVAMTGEITLQGRVLPVGGIKEKVLAAHMYGCTTVIMSEENKALAEEELSELKSHPTIIFTHTMEEVLKKALTNDPFIKTKKPVKKKK